VSSLFVYLGLEVFSLLFHERFHVVLPLDLLGLRNDRTRIGVGTSIAAELRQPHQNRKEEDKA
jgi:hypothetical protein